jgi:hypothetical protein
MIDFKIIVEKIYHVAEYKPGSGAKCPLCNEWNSPNNTGIKIKNGAKEKEISIGQVEISFSKRVRAADREHLGVEVWNHRKVQCSRIVCR